LETRDWQRAIRKLAALEDPKAALVKPIAEAIIAYENHILSLGQSTQSKCKNILLHLAAYCRSAGLDDIMQITVEHLDAYRAGRKIAEANSHKELQIVRQFFSFCFDRRWAGENPAKKIKLPQNIKPAEKIPYTQTEIAKIVAACDVIGNSSYERLRARATVLLMRYTALRISDVATLGRDRVQKRPNVAAHEEDGRDGVFANTRRTAAGVGRAAVSEGRNRTSTILPLERRDV
jgi:site-specific recombinase XerD